MGQESTAYDVVIVGGGAAGLGGALTLARARRRVVVVDAGQPRNAPAEGVHGLLGHEGIAPAELLARGRAEVTGYGGEIVDDRATNVARTPAGFAVTLADGSTLEGRRLLVATGLVDELPDIPGVREQWGRGVLHCPYCHGWEVRDQHIAVIATGPMSVHQTLLFSQLSPHVTLLANGQEFGEEELAKLAALGIRLLEGQVNRVESEGDRVTAVRLADGTLVPTDAVVVGTRMVARAEPFAGIGLVALDHPMGMGSFIETDEFGRTSVPGVWAAGNASDLSAQVGAAAAEGVRAAAHINADLVMADADTAVAAMLERSA